MKRLTLFTVFSITLLNTMGIASLVPLLPLLAKTFNIPLESSWRIIASFALPGLICIPFVGIWADRFGRKKVLVPALLLFAVGGVCCLFSRTYLELLFWRMVQGIGSAPLGLLYPTIIADTWQGVERIKAMSQNAIVLGLGTAVSPALGGALAMLDWRLPFLLPLLALPVACIAMRLPLMKPSVQMPFGEYLAKLLQTTREKQTLTLLGLTLCTFIMLSGPIITCFPLLAETLFQATPLESGLIIASASFASGLAATRLPQLYRRFSSRNLFLAAVILYAVSFYTIGFAPALWLLLPPVFIYGLAQGLNIPLVSILLTNQAPDEQRAALMAANAILLRLGQNIGPAVFGTLASLTNPGDAIRAGVVLAVCMATLVLNTKLPSVRSAEETKTASP